MKVAFGADDDSESVRSVLDHLRSVAEVVDLSGDQSWPDFSRQVGEAVVGGEADVGVLMCWTGTGTAIAANKVPGVRAAQAHEAWIAGNARRWNDANVLALSLKRLAPDVAVDCVRAFLAVDAPDPDEVANIEKLRGL